MSLLSRLFGGEAKRTTAPKSLSPTVPDNNQKTVGEVLVKFLLKHEQELKEADDATVAVEVMDALTSIINSNFAKDKIQQGLQHRNYEVRALIREFLSDSAGKVVMSKSYATGLHS